MRMLRWSDNGVGQNRCLQLEDRAWDWQPSERNEIPKTVRKLHENSIANKVLEWYRWHFLPISDIFIWNWWICRRKEMIWKIDKSVTQKVWKSQENKITDCFGMRSAAGKRVLQTESAPQCEIIRKGTETKKITIERYLKNKRSCFLATINFQFNLKRRLAKYKSINFSIMYNWSCNQDACNVHFRSSCRIRLMKNF